MMTNIASNPNTFASVRITELERDLNAEFGFPIKVGYNLRVTNWGTHSDEIINLIKLEVCTYYSITPSLFEGKGKHSNLVKAREMFANLIRTAVPETTLKGIGKHVGHRDHTTIIHNLRKFDDHYQTEPDYAKEYNDLKQLVSMIKTERKPEPTRSELVAQIEDKEEARRAIVERMSEHSAPDSESFYQLVKQKQDIIIAIEGLKQRINAIDWKAQHADGYPGPAMNQPYEHH